MSNSKLLGDVGRFLLGLLLVVSVIWTLVSPSFESIISALAALAGITASYDRLREYQDWGRIALIVATVLSLVWVLTHPVWQSIVSLLVSSIGVIASFSEDFEYSRFTPLTNRETGESWRERSRKSGTSISAPALGLFAWSSWLVVWYVCLHWGFGSFIPGVLPPMTEAAAPMPQQWYVQNSLGFLIWIGLTGLILAWLMSSNGYDSYMDMAPSGVLAIVLGILNAWISYIVFVAHGWNLGEMVVALLVIVFAHMILVGFFASISMAIFGIVVALIWISIMLLFVWVSTVLGSSDSGRIDV